jgi:hypothetical protein
MTISKGCEACNKSVLSLLLLRPSPVSRQKELMPPGSDAVACDDILTPDLLPVRRPTESRFVLRLLRAGYVHVHIPSPPPGVKEWLVFRVTESADLVPAESALFSQPSAQIACSSNGHNATGLKLLSIPQAHKIKDIWIAYSANLWNDTLRKRNKSNPKTMQHIQLAAGGPNTFAPTASNLQSKVLECALATLSIDKAQDHDFRFNSLASQTDKLAENLARAAACHPKTKGKELALVLRDPAGIAAELNALRLRRNEIAKREVQKPENAHPLNSSNALMGLKKAMFDAAKLDSYQNLTPVLPKSQFRPELWPPGTEWVELTHEERVALTQKAMKVSAPNLAKRYEQESLGRAVYPDHEQRVQAWAKQQTEHAWSRMTPHYDEQARQQWLRTFEQRMKAQHYDPLAKCEEDWLAAATDSSTRAYFEKHFDADDPNDPGKAHSPGSVYIRESNYVYSPDPITRGRVHEQYIALLDLPINDPAAVPARSLLANQQSLIELVHTQLTGDSGKEEGGGMRDKMYDFVKGVRAEIKALHKYSWLSTSLAMFGIGQLSALTSAALHVLDNETQVTAKALQRIQKLQYLWGVRQTLDVLATHGALHLPAPNMPVLITMRVDIDTAIQIYNAHRAQDTGISKTKLKRLRGKTGRTVPVTLLTDTDSIRAVQGRVREIAGTNNGSDVRIGARAAGAAVAGAGSMVTLTEEQIIELSARQISLRSKVISGIRTSFVSGVGADIRTIVMGADGRLLLGSLVVQMIGLYYAWTVYQSQSAKKNEQGMRDALYGMYDSTSGALSALMEIWALAIETRIMARSGSQAAAETLAGRSLALGALRTAAGIAGTVGGIINIVANLAKANDAKEAGDDEIKKLYYVATLAFGGISTISAISTVATGAGTLAARGIGGAVASAIAVRAGAVGGASVLGLTITGWGIVLLGAGMVVQIFAIALTPTTIQRWVARSYFGRKRSLLGSSDETRDDMFPKGNWAAEYAGLQAALQEASKQ